MVEFAVDGLEWLGHTLHALDHVIGHDVPFVQFGGVADQAKDRGVLALRIVDRKPHILKMLHQTVYTFLIAILLEYNDHFGSLLYQLKL